MPRRDDVQSVLLIGSGPIIIGQACEFDYSGTQAVKALREEGYKVLLVNSNPATIMTDPELADRTYIEPITPDVVEKIIERERPDALLPTLGGQTALNTAVQLHDRGVLEKYGVKMIGAQADVIKKAEDRELFKKAMEKIGLDTPRGEFAHSMEEALAIRDRIGLPAVIRPSFTLGGSGGGIAYNKDEFQKIAENGLELSMIHEVLIEESIFGWKEFELEVMRDRKDNVVIVCSIENVDPMGIHTGDSITVAPIQTLTDKEYQRMRDAAMLVIREIGVETGGSNIQFAVHPATGRMIVIEMNPRVSRSSALASKATGFPIAKIAAKLAVGYTLDEIKNDITRETPACFEPTIDYCVVKIPRFAFEKFRDADPTLGVQMKSVGETMAIGRTYAEAMQKAVRSLEIGRLGLGLDRHDLFGTPDMPDADSIRQKLVTPNADRLFYVRYAFKAGFSVEDVASLTKIDPWFLEPLAELAREENDLRRAGSLAKLSDEAFRHAKRSGFSDHQIARATGSSEDAVRAERKKRGIKPSYYLVDTCGAEFEAYTPYYYSTYETENENRVSKKKRIVILGSGPNRIGQGIEFDYACVHAALALKEVGFETVMVNSNPETVSTDYDISDLLYFEPLTREDVLNICDELEPAGVIVQFGGQTPLNLASALKKANVPIIGTSPDSIDRAEDRKLFAELLEKLSLFQAPNGTARSYEEALAVARRIGFPVLVRPSFVLGGRAMRIVEDESELERFVGEAVIASPEHPVLIDKFLEDAIEVDVDAIADGETVVVAGIMEHIEQAGIHSGDSTCTLPAHTLSDRIVDEIRRQAVALAKELDVRGLMNVQFAVKNDVVYVLEVNPRASRTIPYVSKAIGVPLAKLAAKIMVGKKLRELGFTEEVEVKHFSVKKPVFPFNKFPGTDIILGPEMRSTGEVMGIDEDLGQALLKAQLAASQKLPATGRIFVSVKDSDKREIVSIAKRFESQGFTIVATRGTHKVLVRNGIAAELVNKIKEGRPNVLDLLKNREIALVVNTPSGKGPRTDEATIRSVAVHADIPCITTIAGATAAASAIEAQKRQGITVRALQEYFPATEPGLLSRTTAAR